MEILDKINALIAKAESAKEIGSMEEAYSFMQKAQELIQKYNIDKSKLDAKSEYLYAFSEKIKISAHWQSKLAQVVAGANFCCVLTTQARKKKSAREVYFKIVGDGQNVSCVVFLFNFIKTQLQKMAREYCRVQIYERHEPRSERPRIYRLFIMGAIIGLHKRMTAMTDETKALVKSETTNIRAFLLKNPDTKMGRSATFQTDDHHSANGVISAYAVSLNSPIATKAPERKLIS